MSKNGGIYVPRGRALEYSPLACDLYKGCKNGCKYCYGASTEVFDNMCETLVPIPNALSKLEADAKRLAGDPREILFSFSSDPYFSEESSNLTREALEICAKYNLRAQILTKGGMKVSRDFDFLRKNNYRFGSTIIFKDEKLREEWEPYAPSIEDRIKAVKMANEMGIYTWVSVEPVINPDSALELIESLIGFVDLWKIGKLNHFPEIEKTIDWKYYLRRVMSLLKGERVIYKNDLIACIN
ncbi:MAG: radical SAM protein [Synergistaceae bacterium]